MDSMYKYAKQRKSHTKNPDILLFSGHGVGVLERVGYVLIEWGQGYTGIAMCN